MNLGLTDTDDASKTNVVVTLGRFVIGEIVIDLSKVEESVEVPYLMMRVDRVCLDLAMTSYGLVANAHIGGVCLIDKVHLGQYKHVCKANEFMLLLVLVFNCYIPSRIILYIGLLLSLGALFNSRYLAYTSSPFFIILFILNLHI